MRNINTSMNWIRQTLRCSALLGGLLLIGAPVWAQTGDPVHGAALFTNTNGAPVSCATSGCHNGFPTTTRNSITRGANNGPRILSAINGNTGGMAVLIPFVSIQDAADIGAYIANPTGASGPAISVTPPTLSFTQTLSTTSTAQSITVANTGSAALTISAIGPIGGAQAPEFAFASGTTCVAGASVAAGGNCKIAVTFTPAAMGAASGSFTITHNATGSPTTVMLSGNVTSAPQAAISVTPASLAFPATAVGSTSASMALTIANTGTASAAVTGVTWTGDFSVTVGTCAGTAFSLAAGQSCALSVSFVPQSIAALTGTLTITHNAPAVPSPVSVTLSGQGAAATGATGGSSSSPMGNSGYGGCSAGDPTTLIDPLLLAMLAISLLALALQRVRLGARSK